MYEDITKVPDASGSKIAECKQSHEQRVAILTEEIRRLEYSDNLERRRTGCSRSQQFRTVRESESEIRIRFER